MHLIAGWNMTSERELMMLNPRKRNYKEQKLLRPDKSHSLPYTIDSYLRLDHPVPSCLRESMLV
jgi:hypothetical protein